MPGNVDSVFFSPQYHDLVGLIYDAIDHPNGFFPFIHRFIQVFDGQSACFAIYDLKAGNLAGVWSANMPDEALTFYAEHVATQDSLLEAAMAVNEKGKLGFVASNLDIEDVDKVRSQTPVGQFMALLGAYDAVGAVAFHDENYLNFFTMQRSKDQPSFRPEDLMTFNLLLPHINRAVRLHTKLASLAATAYTPERMVLEELKRGVLICDTSFRVVFKNAQSDAIISSNPNMSISDQNLLVFGNNELSTSAMIALSNAVRASVEQRSEPDAILCLPNNDNKVTITISPLITTKDDPSKSSQHRGGALVGLYDWSTRPSIDPYILGKIFSLTPSEAKVAAMLANGASLSDIATRTYRTRATVKSHLKSVFRKTNTCRQGELVALLAASSEFV